MELCELKEDKVFVHAQLGFLAVASASLKNVRCAPICTSSTAQGSGGSFKNKKPIGEVGCCESWVAGQRH